MLLGTMNEHKRGCWRIGQDVCNIIAEYVAETVEECDALRVTAAHREEVGYMGPFSIDKLFGWLVSKHTLITRFCLISTYNLTTHESVYYWSRGSVHHENFPYLTSYVLCKDTTIDLRVEHEDVYRVPNLKEWMDIVMYVRKINKI